MESASIRALLEKYFEGETSLSEEKQLQAYFTSGKVATEFEEYVLMFSAFAKARKETFSQTLEVAPRKAETNKPLSWIATAAAAVIAVGLYLNLGQQETFSSSYENEEIAILKTKQALGVMSQMLSQSTAQLEVVDEFNKASSTLFK